MHYVSIKEGKKRIVWSALLVFVAAVLAAVIGASEAFWYFLTGGFSPLIAGFALVGGALMVIRLVGASLADPVIVAYTAYKAP